MDLHVSHFLCHSGCFAFCDLHVLFNTQTVKYTLPHVCVVWVGFNDAFSYFFSCVIVRWFRKQHQKSVSRFSISCGMCAEGHAYIHIVCPALFLFIAQISRLMTANCGAIVLMLIEFSMWSFHECLLAQFLWYCIKMCIFFPSSFPNQIWYWMEAV